MPDTATSIGVLHNRINRLQERVDTLEIVLAGLGGLLVGLDYITEEQLDKATKFADVRLKNG